ncbi:hypothetical protein [Lentzea sp. NPDC092896]|uniref:hypothetical protein n=1 Tax=Lentzea sp. NPDC092896 TaxID=3364127 RepID=UPI0038050587
MNVHSPESLTLGDDLDTEHRVHVLGHGRVWIELTPEFPFSASFSTDDFHHRPFDGWSGCF